MKAWATMKVRYKQKRQLQHETFMMMLSMMTT